ncbi:hypothetical protein AXF42_Ash009058 [Apostasia shenzhenica]|uniref:Uncharacterized protein n=1 Tax=Apostasia shenzhenica TaxID=1088818 RepID=A0A2I0ADD3_9ASPA|nr:hypothetical protein AXF42_Ash009058 [Apostasia shenzhenica]
MTNYNLYPNNVRKQGTIRVDSGHGSGDSRQGAIWVGVEHDAAGRDLDEAQATKSRLIYLDKISRKAGRL